MKGAGEEFPTTLYVKRFPVSDSFTAYYLYLKRLPVAM